MQPPQTDKIGYANVVGHICGHGENTLGGKLSKNSVFGPLYKLVIFVILCYTSYIVDPFLTYGYWIRTLENSLLELQGFVFQGFLIFRFLKKYIFFPIN